MSTIIQFQTIIEKGPRVGEKMVVKHVICGKKFVLKIFGLILTHERSRQKVFSPDAHLRTRT